MRTSRDAIRAWVKPGFVLAGVATALLSGNAPAYAQAGGAPGGGRPAPQAGVPGRGVLGGVPMTAADSAVQAIVDRLDFQSYKALLKGLTQFGDREQGTQRNADAINWIEAQLKSWGYAVERLKYEYWSRTDSTLQPREEVYATKVGRTVPG
ncbi:MAG: hypothetical protein HYW52_06325, partial [Gemmatimonadetes bacterium]|nr:hypothetical protein [Gemmatimonadota bacterium]